MKRERNSGILDFEHGMWSKVGVVIKNELKRGNSGLLANASGLCERISANDVEIQYRESTSFDLEGHNFKRLFGIQFVGITLQLIRYDNNHAATVKKHDASKKHVKTGVTLQDVLHRKIRHVDCELKHNVTDYEEHLPFIQKCVKGTDVTDS
ncbi:hypothetical protein Tco_1439247 [Tanacetum coccineum]